MPDGNITITLDRTHIPDCVATSGGPHQRWSHGWNHSKLSWYHDQYEDVTKSVKALEEKLSYKKDRHHKAESRQSKLETELNNLWKEAKTLGKHKASPVSGEWHEWVSVSDSDTAEHTLSKGSRKQWRCDHAAPELPAEGMIPFSDTTPMDVSLGHVLPLIGHTKFGKEGPDLPLPMGIVKPMLIELMLPLWGKGDPPASITGKLPHPLGNPSPDRDHGRSLI